jgi:hypothetical protein
MVILIAGNANKTMVGSVSQHFAGAWSQAVGSMLVHFGRNLASVAMKVFSYLIYKEIFKHSSGHLHVCQFNAHHSAEWLIIIIILKRNNT